MVDNFEIDIKKAVEVLNQSGVILYPTDTIWGLGCDATDEQAIDKIFKIKQRPANKSVIILLADKKDLFEYIAAPPITILDMFDEFARPTTIVFEGGINVADNALSEDGSIAIRLTKDPFCKALIKRLGKPLVSTSANLSGAPNPAYYNAVDEKIKTACDYVVNHRQDDVTQHNPSDIFKWDDENEQLIRLR